MIHPAIALLSTGFPFIFSMHKSRSIQVLGFTLPLLLVFLTGPSVVELTWWLAPFGWSINADGTALFFARIAASLTMAVALYSGAYVPVPNRSYFLGLALFQAAAIAVLFSADFVNFFIFWELVALSLYFLIRTNEPDVAHRYFVIQFLGASVLFAGIMGYFYLTGNLAVAEVPSSMRPLFIIGIGVKAALLGLHFWLPDAHTKAPSPISALLSGITVKLGIYGFIRLTPEVEVLLYLGLVMAVYGGIYALLQHDAKTILAYSTISQLGYIIAAIGVGGYTAAQSHTLSHALFKGLLFLAVGAAGYRLGTRDLLKMGGLAKTMPLTTMAATVAALAIAGIPPFNGYVSKQLIKEALSPQGSLIYILTVADYITVIYIAKLLYYGFYRARPDLSHKPTQQGAGKSKKFARREQITEVPLPMSAALLILASLCLLTGLTTSPNLAAFTFGPTTASPWQFGKIVGSLRTGAIGLTLFFLARPLLRPIPRTLNDIGWLYGILTSSLEGLQKRIQQFHTGDLNQYLVWYIGFMIMVMLLLYFR